MTFLVALSLPVDVVTLETHRKDGSLRTAIYDFYFLTTTQRLSIDRHAKLDSSAERRLPLRLPVVFLL